MFSQPVGRITEVLGEIDDPGMEIEIAVRKYGVPHEFSDEALGLARTLPASLDDNAEDRSQALVSAQAHPATLLGLSAAVIFV